MAERRSRRLRAVLAIGLVVATLTAFWPVTTHPFVNLDDNVYVTENPHVRGGPTPGAIAWAVTTGYHANWHPLTWLSHMIDVRLFGLDPGKHHLVSLLLHAANVLALFLLLAGMTGAAWRSAFVAALFAIHPLHVESVAWAAERKDVLSTFFWLLSTAAYVLYARAAGSRRRRPGGALGAGAGLARAGRDAPGGVGGRDSGNDASDRRARAGWYAASLGLFALGLASKPMLVTLPFTLLLLDLWPLGRLSPGARGGSEDPDRPAALPAVTLSRLAAEKIPFFVLSAASCIVTFLAQRSGGAVGGFDAYGACERIANAIVSYVLYLWKTLWPSSLSVFYPHPHAGLPTWEILFCGLLLAGVTALAVALRRRALFLTVGWLWYLGTLVPVIGLVQVGGQAMADRYTYVPLIGIFVVIAWGVPAILGLLVGGGPSSIGRPGDDAAARKPAGVHSRVAARGAHRSIAPDGGVDRPILRAPTGIGLGAAGILALAALFAATRLQVGYWRGDAALFEHALAVTEGNWLAHNNLGLALLDTGDRAAAIAQYEAALSIRPEYPDALANLGFALAASGRFGEAIPRFEAALALSPEDPRLDFQLASTLARAGRAEEAIGRYEAALRLRPDFSEAHDNLANLLVARGKVDEAVGHYEAALRLAPGNAAARYNLARALAGQGRLDEAAAQLTEALRIHPDFPEAHNRLGLLLLRQGRAGEAAAQFEEALREKPGWEEARKNLEAARGPAR